MSEHKVTENLVQRNAETSATLSCSCGLSVEGSLRRKPLRALRAELTSLHEAGREKTERKILVDAGGSLPKPNMPASTTQKKEKKSKKRQPVEETDANDAPEFSEPDSNNPEWPDEGRDQS